MNFRARLLRKSESDSEGGSAELPTMPAVPEGKISLSLLLRAGQKESQGKFIVQKCDRCFRPFRLPSQFGVFYTATIDRHFIDVGGMCLPCHAYVCPEHAKFVPAVPAAGGGGCTMWRLGCGRCGSPLVGSSDPAVIQRERLVKGLSKPQGAK
jgi:hypothetical protein